MRKYEVARWSVPLICIAALCLLLGSVVVEHFKSRGSIDAAFTRLRLIHELRATALEDLLASLRTEVTALSNNVKVRRALAEFQSGWRKSGHDASVILKRAYQKGAAKQAVDTIELPVEKINSYQLAHRAFDPWAGEFLRHFGYYDIFLLDAAGNILYTHAKEDDFAENVYRGDLSHSNLAELIRRLASGSGETAFTDFEKYSPSDDAPAAFAGTALVDQAGKILGYVVIQLPREPLERILLQADGLGKTGETYAVGPDKLMRNQSRFIQESTLLRTKVETRAAQQGLFGEAGSGIILDYRGVPVLSVWAPFNFGGVPWALIAEIDEAEVRPTPWWWRVLEYTNSDE